jgi:hypothetical protein
LDATTISAIAAGIALILTSIANLITSIRGNRKTDSVAETVNGHTTALITEIQTLKRQLDIQDESVTAKPMSEHLGGRQDRQ